MNFVSDANEYVAFLPYIGICSAVKSFKKMEMCSEDTKTCPFQPTKQRNGKNAKHCKAEKIAKKFNDVFIEFFLEACINPNAQIGVRNKMWSKKKKSEIELGLIVFFLLQQKYRHEKCKSLVVRCCALLNFIYTNLQIEASFRSRKEIKCFCRKKDLLRHGDYWT